MTDIAIKPCPFCCHSASVGYLGDYEVIVSCDGDEDCPGRAGISEYYGDISDQTEDEAIAKAVAKWNTRAPDPALRALVLAAREVEGTKASGYNEPLVYELPFRMLFAALAPFADVKEEE